jgi:predicted dehydrogenase
LNIAIIGCGYVADLYMASLARHPQLRVVGAFDVAPERARRFGAYWRTPVFPSAEALLAGAGFELALNLTNPGSHLVVSRTFLAAGKHVYSEKPLAMSWREAQELADFAARRGLALSCAPCNHLSEAAQTMKRALDAGAIGRPRLVYAELDAGFMAITPHDRWRGASGAPWPAEDEFAVGCTLEHAGYALSWMLRMFGPVERVVSFGSLQRAGKPTGGRPEGEDFSVACLAFRSGLAARLTCSVVAPPDRRFTVFGDEGVLRARDLWSYRTPVTLRRYLKVRRRLVLSPLAWRLAPAETGPRSRRRGATDMDFARGPAELAAAVSTGRPSEMPIDFVLHLNEIALAIGAAPADYRVTSRFAPTEAAAF